MNHASATPHTSATAVVRRLLCVSSLTYTRSRSLVLSLARSLSHTRTRTCTHTLLHTRSLTICPSFRFAFAARANFKHHRLLLPGEKDASCEADESCPCDLAPPLRKDGGEDCESGCTACVLDACTCCNGLTKRSQTLCCPPKPRNSEWVMAVSAADASTAGTCGWKCVAQYGQRTRSGDPPPFDAGSTTLFDWNPAECCAKPGHSVWTNPNAGCMWKCDLNAGFTRNGDYSTYHIDQGGWDCFARCSVFVCDRSV
jgi:hypothetical protein